MRRRPRLLSLVSVTTFVVALAASLATSALAQERETRAGVGRGWGSGGDESTDDRFAQQVTVKRMTDALYDRMLGRSHRVRKVAYPGADGLTIPAYVFAPRDTTRRYPVIILVHGGVHGDFTLGYLDKTRALLDEGYVVIAPDFRGSTGYGKPFYDAIDYGGLEVDDCIAARDYLGAFVSFADTSHTVIMGWSHGGYIALLAVIRRPELFRAAVAHVPVTDLPTRIRMHSDEYHELFAAQPAFGGRLEERPDAYIDRSPIAHARELRVPVLVHAADNDDDVFIVENRNLRDSMVVAGMDRRGLYTYREFKNPPGGHSFGMLDTKEGRESWSETVVFLRRYLRP